MTTKLSWVLFVYGSFVLVSFLSFGGCTKPDTANENKNEVDDNVESTEHEHGDADKLVWKQRNIQQQGFSIDLGHHGEVFHFGEGIEPAVMITNDGQDVADAIVYNSMISSDGKSVLVKEIKTAFEPKTEDEPAHYAQGELIIPQGAETFMVKFRIQLPGVEGESLYEIKMEAH